jgi:hypothetical protein
VQYRTKKYFTRERDCHPLVALQTAIGAISMFNRYSVTDSENKRKALKKVEKYRKSKRAVAISQKHRWTLQACGQK